MRVWANDTFCLYIGWLLVFIGFLFMVTTSYFTDVYGFKAGIACVALGIATQLMAFQRKPKDKDIK